MTERRIELVKAGNDKDENYVEVKMKNERIEGDGNCIR